ncbi:MAG: T9SS type B sorting domain-containing protein [Flavobacteriaceae bacterium]
MKRNLLIVLVLLLGSIALGQTCPNPVLISPFDTQTNVPVDTSISWNSVVGVSGYKISIGTTPGGGEIINELNIGSATSFTPPNGLPELTQIFVTVSLFIFDTILGEITLPCNSESFVTEDVVTPPPCTAMISPLNGETDVNFATNINWSSSPTASGYLLTLGTAPGLGDILNNQDLGNQLFYNPLVDFPTLTTIYVQVTPYNENGSLAPCPEESFTTGDIVTIPGCTSLISPLNGATNVPLSPFLEWTSVPGATGYRVILGSTPFTADVLDNVVFSTNSTSVNNFEPNKTYFITIIPLNAAGEAFGCTQESFSTILGCGPFFDISTGELITLNPPIDFPELISFCDNQLPFATSATDVADGYRWFRIDQAGNEILISDTAEVVLEETGDYRYEAYNIVEQSGISIECPSEQLFSLIISAPATITEVRLSEITSGTRINVAVEGPGDYEYALDNIDGPYQDSNVFETSAEFLYTIFVRDKNGCGISEETVEQDLTLQGFPKFFTPNGDGINDFWQFITPEALTQNPLEVIFIFDRYGKLLVQIDPFSQGWDGSFNGGPLPSSDYWFRAHLINESVVNGHFTLKR